MKKTKLWMSLAAICMVLASCNVSQSSAFSAGPTESSSESVSTQQQTSDDKPSSSDTQPVSSSDQTNSSEVPEPAEAAIVSIKGAKAGEEPNSYFMLVDKDTSSVPLLDKVSVSKGCTWSLFDGNTEIFSKIAKGSNGSLTDGENVFRILVKSDSSAQKSTYKLTVYRSFEVQLNYYFENKLIDFETVSSGYEHPLLKNPYIKGYVFKKWQDKNKSDIEKITPWERELSFYAVADISTYSIPLELNGGELDSTIFEVIYDSDYTLPNPVKNNYEFDGWVASAEKDGGQFDVPISGTWAYDNIVKLSAKWKAVEFEISYSLGGGENNANNPTKYTVESEFVLEDPTFEHYDFMGWFLGDEKVTTVLGEWASDITLEAKWSVEKHQVKFVNDDGSLLYETTVGYGKHASYRGAVPHSAAKEKPQEGYDYAFLGWAKGDEKYEVLPKIEEDSVFVAVYASKEDLIGKTIRYIDEDGSDLGVYNAFANKSGSVSVPLPLCYDYLTDYSIFDITDSYDGEDEADWIFKVSREKNEYVFVEKGTIKPFSFSETDEPFDVNIPVWSNGYFVSSIDFSNCNKIKSVFIPRTISRLSGSAFSGSSLNSIFIPASITSIGPYAFSGCSFVESIIVDLDNPVYDSRDNCNAIIETRTNALIAGCANTVIPDTVNSIASPAFRDCSSIKSVIIPSNVTSIGANAFSGCTSLESIYVDPNNMVYDSRDNCNAIIETRTNALIAGCANTVVPDTVASIASSAFRGCSSLKEIYIPSSVASIGDYAFSDCSSLKEISIPPSVTSIGDYAFSGCTSLESVIIPLGATIIGSGAFNGCGSRLSVLITAGLSETTIAPDSFMGFDSMKYLTIGPGITSIGDYAFSGCHSLESVSIPSGVTSIGKNAFSGCTSLESVLIPSSVDSIGANAFYGCDSIRSLTIPSRLSIYTPDCLEELTITGGKNSYWLATYAYQNHKHLKLVTIEDGVTSIGDHVFEGCDYIGSLTMPAGLKIIKSQRLEELTIAGGNGVLSDSQFSGLPYLRAITILSGVTSIGKNAFSGCTSLESVSILSGVTSIGDFGFSGCASLKEVSIPSSVAYIGTYAFSGCSSLGSISVDPNNAVYDSRDNCNAIVKTKTNSLILGCSNTVIPDTVTSIGDSAFRNCASLKEIFIPSGVASIGNYAFYGCSSLKEISIPPSVTSIGANAFSGCASLKEIFIPSGVASIGGYAFYGCSSLGSIFVDPNNAVYDSRDNCNAIIETETKSLILGCSSTAIPDTVTSIGKNAFSGCSSLGSVSIPSSVASIGDYAFKDCASLKEIFIPSGVTFIGTYAFSGCSSLGSVSIPSSVASIGDCTFSGCSSLESVSIPSSVTSIGYCIFESCDSIRSLTIPAGLSINKTQYLEELTIAGGNGALPDSQFSDSPSLKAVTILSGVTSIGKNTFSDCPSLGSVTILSGVTSIGDYAFSGCTSLGSVSIPSSVTSIGTRAFESCDSIKSIYVDPNNTVYDSRGNCNAIVKTETNSLILGCSNTVIPDTVASIGDWAFYGCSFIKEISIPSSVTSIGANAFSGCSSLETIEVDPYNPVYDSRGNCNAIIKTETNSLILGCSNTVIPDTVTSIGDHAFYGCSSLKEVFIPSGVTYIGDYAFSGCSSLETIDVDPYNPVYDNRGNCNAIIETRTNALIVGCANTVIPDTVTSIGDRAFYGCSSLKEISIPSSVTSIGDYAFSGCSSLKEASIPSGVSSIGVYAFLCCDSIRSLTIPAGFGLYGLLYLEELTITAGTRALSGLRYSCFPSLRAVIISSGIGSIGDYAFSGCPFLESVSIPSSVTSIGANAFSDCPSLKEITIPSGVTSIGWFAFSDCPSLESVSIPSSVTYIGTRAFEDCDSIKTIVVDPANRIYDSRGNCNAIIKTEANSLISGCSNTVIPDTVTSIASNAFFGCSSLESVSIPSSVISIGDYAFSGCTSLESVSIPSSVISIGANAFSGCDSIKSLTIPSGLSIYKSKSLEELKIIAGFETLIITGWEQLSSLKHVTIEYGVTLIGDYAFSGCTSLESISIPSSVISIGANAFSGCDSIKSLTIPSSVKDIGDSAFSGCTSLESVIMKSSKAQEYDETQSISDPESLPAIDYVKVFVEKTWTNVWAWTGTNNNLFYSWPGVPLKEYDSDWRTYDFIGYSSINIVFNTNNGSKQTKDLVVPSAGYWWFYQGQWYKTNPLNKTYVSIGDKAFENCSSLVSLVLSPLVRNIGIAAFNGDSLLDHVFFEGTADQYKQISRQDAGNQLDNPYYYSENEPTALGNYWHYVDDVPTIW